MALGLDEILDRHTPRSKLLTHSRLSAFRACQRLHRYKYEMGIRARVEADALRFGTLMHRGLEAWWLGHGDLEAALAAVDVEADPFDRAKARALLKGYHARWSDQDFEILGVEVEFRAPVLNPLTGRRSLLWQIGGKIDAIVRYRDGRIAVVEHKTTSEDLTPGSSYWLRLRMDAQVSIYFDGAASLGHDVSECLYDVVGKPGLRPLQANKKRDTPETPDEYEHRICEAIIADPNAYYGRAPVVRLERELVEARWDVWQLARAIRANQQHGHAPRNPDACVRWGRACEFLEVCSGQASLDDPERFRVIENLHPELTT